MNLIGVKISEVQKSDCDRVGANRKLAAVAVVFTVGSYQILFGAVVSPLHSRVNFHRHHVALSDVTLTVDRGVAFKAYVDAGPDTGAAYVIAARLVDEAGETIAQWDGAALAALPDTAIRNVYPYVWASHFKTEKIGFSGQTGARDDHPAAARRRGRRARADPCACAGGDQWGDMAGRSGGEALAKPLVRHGPLPVFHEVQ